MRGVCWQGPKEWQRNAGRGLKGVEEIISGRKNGSPHFITAKHLANLSSASTQKIKLYQINW